MREALGGAVGFAITTIAGRGSRCSERRKEKCLTAAALTFNVVRGGHSRQRREEGMANFQRDPACTRYGRPYEMWSSEALPKTPIPPVGVIKVYFCNPFSLKPLLVQSPSNTDHPGGAAGEAAKSELNIPASPIILSRPALDPFDATVTAFNSNSFACTISTTFAARCNYSLAGGLAASP